MVNQVEEDGAPEKLADRQFVPCEVPELTIQIRWNQVANPLRSLRVNSFVTWGQRLQRFRPFDARWSHAECERSLLDTICCVAVDLSQMPGQLS